MTLSAFVDRALSVALGEPVAPERVATGQGPAGKGAAPASPRAPEVVPVRNRLAVVNPSRKAKAGVRPIPKGKKP